MILEVLMVRRPDSNIYITHYKKRKNKKITPEIPTLVPTSDTIFRDIIASHPPKLPLLIFIALTTNALQMKPQ